MSSLEVTGKTQQDFAALRDEYNESERGMPFEQYYCLSKITQQPDDYDGPQRYCSLRGDLLHDCKNGERRCKYHGGVGENTGGSPENLEPLNRMKHGLKATEENLIKDFDKKDRALYEWVIDTYPEAYDIDLDADPNTRYDLHRLAVEMVRAERGRGYLLQEGEVKEQEVRDESGMIIIDDNGDIVTEKSQHYLNDMMYQQDNKITKLEKELGISRKEQRKGDSADAVADAIEGFTELGSAFLSREDTDYDPDERPWEDNTDGTDN